MGVWPNVSHAYWYERGFQTAVNLLVVSHLRCSICISKGGYFVRSVLVESQETNGQMMGLGRVLGWLQG